MDIASIGALLGSLKTATEIARFVKETDLNLAKVETKLKLADLISALADAKIEAAEVQQVLLERDERIRDLEKQLKVKASLVWKEPCYWMETSSGVEEPYCQHCYDSAGKLARLHSDQKGLYVCRVCDKQFTTHERSRADAEAFKHARRIVGRGIT